MVNALRRHLPALRVTVRTALPHGLLRRRLEGEFHLVPAPTDVGLVMGSALEVLVEETARAYAELHRSWEETVAAEAEALRHLAPDLVLANVSHLSVAAAARAGIPAVALCSLNWADLYLHYCGHRPEAPRIHRQILESYRRARLFLQPEPSMPMKALPRRRRVGPIARKVAQGRSPDHLVLVSWGGLELSSSPERWPRLAGVRWVFSGPRATDRQDFVTLEDLGDPFLEVLGRSRVLLTKPGYGSFVEAAANGVPVLYVSRGDWPEEPWLVTWLERHGLCRRLDRQKLQEGSFAAELEELLEAPRPSPVEAPGAEQAAEVLHRFFLRPSSAAESGPGRDFQRPPFPGVGWS